METSYDEIPKYKDTSIQYSDEPAVETATQMDDDLDLPS
jgi:hypothetical protein